LAGDGLKESFQSEMMPLSGGKVVARDVFEDLDQVLPSRTRHANARHYEP
jgi:hypothetical protein